MDKLDNITTINANEIINVVGRTLRLIDKRLVEHGERVAYIANEILEFGRLQDRMNWKKLLVLSVFHDVGAYKTEEIDNMVEFETENIWNHSIYGYLFLKNMTPLEDYAEAILYHHVPYQNLEEIVSDYKEYANLIFLADRIDILIQGQGMEADFHNIVKHANTRFSSEYIDYFMQANQDKKIQKALLDGTYISKVEYLTHELYMSVEYAMEYVKMLVYSVDFRSQHTVTHTINTTAISVDIANRLRISQLEKEQIYVGALLHDIGKIAIPLNILEFQGKLTEPNMKVMKTHVEHTEEIISGLVSETICKIAVRHHEKLDGTGYPHHLTDEELTLPEKIVAVADILSALTSKRSYKEEFPKEKTLSIIQMMRDEGKLSEDVCNVVLEEYDDIMQHTDANRDPVIQMYYHISSEYDQLLEKFQVLSTVAVTDSQGAQI